MKTPQEKYDNDPMYAQLVNLFSHMIGRAEFTPSEIREAGVLACIHHEQRRTLALGFHMSPEVIHALETLEQYKNSAGEKPGRFEKCNECRNRTDPGMRYATNAKSV